MLIQAHEVQISQGKKDVLRLIYHCHPFRTPLQNNCLGRPTVSYRTESHSQYRLFEKNYLVALQATP